MRLTVPRARWCWAASTLQRPERGGCWIYEVIVSIAPGKIELFILRVVIAPGWGLRSHKLDASRPWPSGPATAASEVAVRAELEAPLTHRQGIATSVLVRTPPQPHGVLGTAGHRSRVLLTI